MKKRVKKLEELALASEQELLIFCTVYEDRNGNADNTYRLAFVSFGNGRTLSVEQSPEEGGLAFKDHLNALQRMPFECARATVEAIR